MQLEAADANGTYALRVGDTVQIRLAESPGTGYRWTVEQLDESRLVLEDSVFIHSPRDLVGGSGLRTLTLRARRDGTTTVCFAQRRPWAGGGGPVNQFQATFTIVGKGEV